ncbi:MAG: hypothetical protein HQK77_17090 [Desulfobacterales bacterium]|nr:hypothetical protein [Desulfobacterales bacterium]
MTEHALLTTQHELRLKKLHDKRIELMRMEPEQALDEILDYEQSAALVHSFPEQDLFLLIHAIGLEDAYPLLSLASFRQWEYMLDVEIWSRDQIDLGIVSRWLSLLFMADNKRFVCWVIQEKNTFIEYYLYKNIEVQIRNHDEDPSIFGDDFFTIDDVFYVRFRDINDPVLNNLTGIESNDLANRDDFLEVFLEKLADLDHVTYQSVLFESMTILSAETEEEEYRMRNERLSEKGFMPFDEAMKLYSPIQDSEFSDQLRGKKIYQADQSVHIPMYSADMLKQEHLFSQSLQCIDVDEGIIEQIQNEFIGLCNTLISADQKIIHELEELRDTIKTTCTYVSLGIEQLMRGDSTTSNPQKTAYCIQNFPLENLFRLGFTQTLKLKWLVVKWQKQSWYASVDLPLQFWDEYWFGVLGGVLLKKPLYFDNYRTGVMYREFISIKEIQETRQIIERMIKLDRLFLSLNLKASDIPIRKSHFTWKTLLLTLWARFSLHMPEVYLPINIDDFKRLFEQLWIEKDHNKSKTITELIKRSFLNWISKKTHIQVEILSESMGHIFESLFQDVEDEYGLVQPQSLDCRYIHLFFVSQGNK